MSSFNQLIKGDQPVLVDFYADWCGPCKMMKPVLEQLSKKEGDRLRVLKVDVDRNREAANAYQIQSIPTMILFHKGKILWRTAGAMSLPQLTATLNKFLPPVPSQN